MEVNLAIYMKIKYRHIHFGPEIIIPEVYSTDILQVYRKTYVQLNNYSLVCNNKTIQQSNIYPSKIGQINYGRSKQGNSRQKLKKNEVVQCVPLWNNSQDIFRKERVSIKCATICLRNEMCFGWGVEVPPSCLYQKYTAKSTKTHPSDCR